MKKSGIIEFLPDVVKKLVGFYSKQNLNTDMVEFLLDVNRDITKKVGILDTIQTQKSFLLFLLNMQFWKELP